MSFLVLVLNQSFFVAFMKESDENITLKCKLVIKHAAQILIAILFVSHIPYEIFNKGCVFVFVNVYNLSFLLKIYSKISFKKYPLLSEQCLNLRSLFKISL